MPGGDRTGPHGTGPMTGRAAGFCAGFPMPGFMNAMPGRGAGRGFGCGRGWRGGRGRGFGRGRGRWFGGTPYAGVPFGTPNVSPSAPPTREQESDALKGQAEYLEQTLGDIRKRLAELETEKAERP